MSDHETETYIDEDLPPQIVSVTVQTFGELPLKPPVKFTQDDSLCTI